MSAAPALFTVQTALLGTRQDSDLLLPAAPLGAMHGEAAGTSSRPEARPSEPATRVTGIDDGAVVLADGERVDADGIVVALPPRRAHGSWGSRIRRWRTRRS